MLQMLFKHIGQIVEVPRINISQTKIITDLKTIQDIHFCAQEKYWEELGYSVKKRYYFGVHPSDDMKFALGATDRAILAWALSETHRKYHDMKKKGCCLEYVLHRKNQ